VIYIQCNIPVTRTEKKRLIYALHVVCFAVIFYRVLVFFPLKNQNTIFFVMFNNKKKQSDIDLRHLLKKEKKFLFDENPLFFGEVKLII
jgi:hypothetical protein